MNWKWFQPWRKKDALLIKGKLTNAVEEGLLLALTGAAVSVHSVHIITLLTFGTVGVGVLEWFSLLFLKITVLRRLVSPLDASVAAVGGPQLVHQRRRGFAFAPARDRLDLVGVRNMWHHVPVQADKGRTASLSDDVEIEDFFFFFSKKEAFPADERIIGAHCSHARRKTGVYRVSPCLPA